MKPPTTLDEVRVIASGLCHASDISVTLSERRWAWVPRTRTILVPRDALLTLGRDATLGVITHEVGHALYSRYTRWLDAGVDPLVPKLLNALEDPRVEVAMMNRYPGAALWVHAARDRHTSPPRRTVATLDLLHAFVEEGWARHAPAEALNERAAAYRDDVARALSQTREARAMYLDAFQPAPNHRPPTDAMDAHATRGIGDSPACPWEAWVEVLAHRAYEVALRDVLPHFRAVRDRDVTLLAAEMHADPEVRGWVRDAVLDRDSSAAFAVARSAILRAPTDHGAPPAKLLVEARACLDLLLGRGGAPYGASRPPRPDAANDEASQPDRAEADIVEALVRTLEEALPPRRPVRNRVGYRSGASLSLPHAMAYDADRRQDTLFARRERRTRRRAAAVLLVDLSGSMQGAPMRAAVAAVRVLCQALARAEIPFSVLGFQTHIIEVLAFDATLDGRALARLDGLMDEPAGRPFDGLASPTPRRPEFTDHAPCLLDAAARLLSRAEEDRILVCISDGDPNGARSTESDLHAAVAKLRGRVQLIALGVGPGTERVAEFYPNAFTCVPLSDLPKTVGRAIERALSASHT